MLRQPGGVHAWTHTLCVFWLTFVEEVVAAVLEASRAAAGGNEAG